MCCSLGYSQTNKAKYQLKNRYNGVMAQKPDSSQIVTETPPSLLKKKYDQVKPATAEPIIIDNKTKKRKQKALPAPVEN